MRSFGTPERHIFEKAVVTNNGDLVLLSTEPTHLFTFTINARMLARCVAPEKPRAIVSLFGVAPPTHTHRDFVKVCDVDGGRVVSGGIGGVVVRSLLLLEQLFVLPCNHPVSSLQLSFDGQKLLAALDSGELSVYSLVRSVA